MDYLQEVACKRVHDQFVKTMEGPQIRCIYVPGSVVVGAGPSGLATAALLKENGVPCLILERGPCIASLWQLKTYDRLHLHLPKQFCELPNVPFPSSYPTYPTKHQFVSYLESYAATFGLDPVFDCTVVRAEFDPQSGFWRVITKGPKREEMIHYMCRWLVVATGENAEEVVPLIEGMEDFDGTILHASLYKNGEPFRGKSVLVVGCGNSGMEVGLDLANNGARPALVVRESVHVLPREMLGRSTFELSMCLLKWLPIRLVDLIILMLSYLVVGNTANLGLTRPKIGPFEYKRLTGKTPVLDVGTLEKIKNGDIKVRKGIKRITNNGVEFVDGNIENYDAIVLATGYKSNVPAWLKDSNMFSEKDGFPRKAFPEGWKGENGLFAVGFARRGLLGASMDARRVAEDIGVQWEADPPPSRLSLALVHNITTHPLTRKINS